MSTSKNLDAKQVKPVRLPVSDGGPIRDTRNAAAAAIASRGGRSSTVLSDLLRNAIGSQGFLGR